METNKNIAPAGVLTYDRIDQLWVDSGSHIAGGNARYEFARAIEREVAGRMAPVVDKLIAHAIATRASVDLSGLTRYNPTSTDDRVLSGAPCMEIDNAMGRYYSVEEVDALLATYPAHQAVAVPIEQERADFEDWFTGRFDEPLQSSECARQWATWIARAGGEYKARDGWKISPQPWGPYHAFPSAPVPPVSATSSSPSVGSIDTPEFFELVCAWSSIDPDIEGITAAERMSKEAWAALIAYIHAWRDAHLARQDQAGAQIPRTAEEAIAFIGSHFDAKEDADDPENVRFQLTVHDLLSAFRWWFDVAPAQVSVPQATVPQRVEVAGAVSMLSGTLNHARDALRFYADREHFHMHDPDAWDTVSGEPQNFYEDEANTATVEDGSVAKQALEDIAYVEAYASAATPAASSESVDTAEMRRLARNKVCIDGHLNIALHDIMCSNSPDGMFALLGSLAEKAIDIALDLSESHIDSLIAARLAGVRKDAESAAARDVLAERRRQQEVEGWTPDHDDGHRNGSMARAASVYALVGSSDGRIPGDELTPSITERLWPWGWNWFKPKSRRHNLVRAGALILAEIERIDRAHSPASGSKEGDAA